MPNINLCSCVNASKLKGKILLTIIVASRQKEPVEMGMTMEMVGTRKMMGLR